MELAEKEGSDPVTDDEPPKIEGDEYTKAIVQTLIDFNQPIEDLEILAKTLKDISNYANESTKFILNHQLFAETSLIDHFISIISDESLPGTLKVLAVYSISPFIPYFNEEQVNSFIEQPFFHEIFNLYFYFFERSQSNYDGLFLAKILQFLSNMSFATAQARDEIISQYPIQDSFETLDAKVIAIFGQIEYVIKFGDFKTQIKHFLIFFKSLCYFPLNQDIYEVACAISLNLAKQLSNENYESLFKIFWYICKNDFVEVVATKVAFFQILLNLSFYRNVTLSTLKCFSKIIKTMDNFNLSKCLDFKLFVDCIAELNAERSIIILDLIEYLITDDPDKDKESSLESKSSEQKNVYLTCFLMNQLLYQLKKVIGSENYTINHKIISFRILKMIVFKNHKPYINEIIKLKFINPMLSILDLHDLMISESVISILLFVMNSCINNQLIFSVISQIKVNNGYQSILTLIDDIDSTDGFIRKRNPVFDEVYQMAKEIIDLIDKIEKENKQSPKAETEEEEEEGNEENKPEWFDEIDVIFSKILNDKKENEEEEEEAKEEEEMESKGPEFLNDIESLLIPIPIDPDMIDSKEIKEIKNEVDEEERRRNNEIKWLKSRDIFVSILEDYSKRDMEEEEDSNN